jgi:hypothetical protein
MLTIDLAEQTAVVTGASRGIGLAVTRALAASGARVIAGARHASAELGQLAADAAVTVLEVDLAQPGGPGDLVALAGDRTVQPPGGGRRPGAAAGQRRHRQRDRGRHPGRRRARAHLVTPGRPNPAGLTAG